MSEIKKLYKKFKRKLIIEGVVSATLFSVLVGFSVAFILSVVFYLTDPNLYIIAIIASLSSFLLAFFVSYFVKFRPSDLQVAQRVDLTGLEERMITMHQLKDDMSYMAQQQRKDACVALSVASAKKIKLKIAKALILSASIMTIIGGMATSLTVMAAVGTVPPIDDLFETIDIYTLNYKAQENGYLVCVDDPTPYDELEWEVEEGSNSKKVLAVAKEGYMFSVWSDGVTTPLREDIDVTGDIEVTAVFVEIIDYELAVLPQEKPEDFGPAGDVDGSHEGADGTAGAYEDYNQIIDGDTYYRDVYEAYYKEAMQDFKDDGIISDEVIDFIEKYYDVIQ